MESVFISRFTMNNIAPKLQKCWTHKIAFKSISKMLKSKRTKFLLELAFYTSEGHICKVLSFHDFWFTVNDKFCSPCPIVDFYTYLITKIGNRNLKRLLVSGRVHQHTLSAPHLSVKENDEWSQNKGNWFAAGRLKWFIIYSRIPY